MYLSEAVNDYLVEKQKNNVKDGGRFYPSSIGRCKREIVYQMLGYPQPPADPRGLMIFENGHGFHNRMEYLLEKAGILIASEVPVKSLELNISGRLDGLVKNLHPEIGVSKEIVTIKDLNDNVIWSGSNNEIAIVEFKSINNRGFNRVFEKTSKQEHLWQIQLYMFLTGIKQGVLYYENKDNQQAWEEWVVYDEKLAAELVKTIKYINNCVKTNVIPLREHSRSSPVCGWCGYNGLCWGTVGNHVPIEKLI